MRLCKIRASYCGHCVEKSPSPNQSINDDDIFDQIYVIFLPIQQDNKKKLKINVLKWLPLIVEGGTYAKIEYIKKLFRNNGN